MSTSVFSLMGQAGGRAALFRVLESRLLVRHLHPRIGVDLGGYAPR
ncbi:MAG: hypothetical protein WCH01_00970 [Methylococcaceae bacterium]